MGDTCGVGRTLAVASDLPVRCHCDTCQDDGPDTPTCPHGDPWCRCDGGAHK